MPVTLMPDATYPMWDVTFPMPVTLKPDATFPMPDVTFLMPVQPTDEC